MMAADFAQLEQHRTALTGHCYRMLGSSVDADDAVQETLVRAWRAYDNFDGRSAVRTWLYRIATNVCIDTIGSRKNRERPFDMGPEGTIDDVLETRERTHWLEPIADAKAVPSDANPAEQLMLRQSIRLAFVAAMQILPPKQRAALLLSEVLGWSAAEVAESLDTSIASVNSALQRARATLAAKSDLGESPLPETLQPLVDRYVSAFERYDVDALSMMLKEDAVLNMPPFTLWLQGRDVIKQWLSGRGSGCRGSRLVPTRACGMPAFGQYRQMGAEPWALIVLEVEGDRIARFTSFLDVETLFPRFGLPMRLT